MIRQVLAVIAVLLPAPALAGVQTVSDRGFVSRHLLDAPGSGDEIWETLVLPARWWNKAHTYSGDSKNLTIDARPGGCFCEILPSTISPNAAPRGGVEHMRVVYVERGRALRLNGALGPLQADAVIGSLTIMLKPTDSGTRILVEYVVGGYFRTDPNALASSVDKVLAEQVLGLANKIGGKLVTTSEPAPKEPVEAPKVPLKGDRIGEIIGR